MSTTTTTTTPKYLPLSAALHFRGVADGVVVDTATAEWAAVADGVGIAAGRYVTGSYAIKSGRNAGKASRVLIPADVEALTEAADKARAAADNWSDKEWIKASRAAAIERADKAAAMVATVRAAGKGKGKGKR